MLRYLYGKKIQALAQRIATLAHEHSTAETLATSSNSPESNAQVLSGSHHSAAGGIDNDAVKIQVVDNDVYNDGVFSEIQTANSVAIPTVDELAAEKSAKSANRVLGAVDSLVHTAVDAAHGAASLAHITTAKEKRVRRQQPSFRTQLLGVLTRSALQFSRALHSKLLDTIITLMGGIIVGAVNIGKVSPPLPPLPHQNRQSCQASESSLHRCIAIFPHGTCRPVTKTKYLNKNVKKFKWGDFRLAMSRRSQASSICLVLSSACSHVLQRCDRWGRHG